MPTKPKPTRYLCYSGRDRPDPTALATAAEMIGLFTIVRDYHDYLLEIQSKLISQWRLSGRPVVESSLTPTRLLRISQVRLRDVGGNLKKFRAVHGLVISWLQSESPWGNHNIMTFMKNKPWRPGAKYFSRQGVGSFKQLDVNVIRPLLIRALDDLAESRVILSILWSVTPPYRGEVPDFPLIPRICCTHRSSYLHDQWPWWKELQRELDSES